MFDTSHDEPDAYQYDTTHDPAPQTLDDYARIELLAKRIRDREPHGTPEREAASNIETTALIHQARHTTGDSDGD